MSGASLSTRRTADGNVVVKVSSDIDLESADRLRRVLIDAAAARRGSRSTCCTSRSSTPPASARTSPDATPRTGSGSRSPCASSDGTWVAGPAAGRERALGGQGAGAAGDLAGDGGLEGEHLYRGGEDGGGRDRRGG